MRPLLDFCATTANAAGIVSSERIHASFQTMTPSSTASTPNALHRFRQRSPQRPAMTQIALLPGGKQLATAAEATSTASGAGLASVRNTAATMESIREQAEAVAENVIVPAACDVTLIASGTATLEAALFKRPMVIAYNLHWLSWRIMAPKQIQPWIGLPNILCREFVVPEFIQDAATPQALSDAVLEWLDAEPGKIEVLQDRFTALHLELQRDTCRLAADAIEKVLQG